MVAAIPHTTPDLPEASTRYFIWEQIGMDISLWSEALVNEGDAADEPDDEDED